MGGKLYKHLSQLGNLLQMSIPFFGPVFGWFLKEIQECF